MKPSANGAGRITPGRDKMFLHPGWSKKGWSKKESPRVVQKRNTRPGGQKKTPEPGGQKCFEKEMPEIKTGGRYFTKHIKY